MTDSIDDSNPETSYAPDELAMFADYVIAEGLRRGLNLTVVVVATTEGANLQSCISEEATSELLRTLSEDPGFLYEVEHRAHNG